MTRRKDDLLKQLRSEVVTRDRLILSLYAQIYPPETRPPELGIDDFPGFCPLPPS